LEAFTRRARQARIRAIGFEALNFYDETIPLAADSTSLDLHP
jgi:hypothetical protein